MVKKTSSKKKKKPAKKAKSKKKVKVAHFINGEHIGSTDHDIEDVTLTAETAETEEEFDLDDSETHSDDLDFGVDDEADEDDF